MVLGCIIFNSRNDGIGSHAGLKIQWAVIARTSSNLVSGTKYNYNNSRQVSWVIIIISAHLPSVEKGNGTVNIIYLMLRGHVAHY